MIFLPVSESEMVVVYNRFQQTMATILATQDQDILARPFISRLEQANANLNLQSFIEILNDLEDYVTDETRGEFDTLSQFFKNVIHNYSLLDVKKVIDKVRADNHEDEFLQAQVNTLAWLDQAYEGFTEDKLDSIIKPLRVLFNAAENYPSSKFLGFVRKDHTAGSACIVERLGSLINKINDPERLITVVSEMRVRHEILTKRHAMLSEAFILETQSGSNAQTLERAVLAEDANSEQAREIEELRRMLALKDTQLAEKEGLIAQQQKEITEIEALNEQQQQQFNELKSSALAKSIESFYLKIKLIHSDDDSVFYDALNENDCYEIFKAHIETLAKQFYSLSASNHLDEGTASANENLALVEFEALNSLLEEFAPVLDAGERDMQQRYRQVVDKADYTSIMWQIYQAFRELSAKGNEHLIEVHARLETKADELANQFGLLEQEQKQFETKANRDSGLSVGSALGDFDSADLVTPAPATPVPAEGAMTPVQTNGSRTPAEVIAVTGVFSSPERSRRACASPASPSAGSSRGMRSPVSPNLYSGSKSKSRNRTVPVPGLKASNPPSARVLSYQQ